MTGFSEAIAARVTASKDAADEKRRQPFELDPELERQAARMEELAHLSPKEYADANFGDLRSRIATYNRRKAEHEEKTR